MVRLDGGREPPERGALASLAEAPRGFGWWGDVFVIKP